MEQRERRTRTLSPFLFPRLPTRATLVTLDVIRCAWAMWLQRETCKRARARLGTSHTYGSLAAPMSHLHLRLHHLFVLVPDALCPTSIKPHRLIQHIVCARHFRYMNSTACATTGSLEFAISGDTSLSCPQGKAREISFSCRSRSSG